MNHDLITETLTELLNQLSLSFSGIKVEEEGKAGFIRVDIESAQPSRIIGWHGETLNSIQALLKAIIRSKEKLDRAPFLVLDVDGYRRMQEEKVCQMAAQKADLVRRTGNRIALPPMSPYFRRVVHLHVANAKDLQDLMTESAGEGDYRQIVLRLKDERSVQGEGELSPVMAEADTSDAADWGNLDV